MKLLDIIMRLLQGCFQLIVYQTLSFLNLSLRNSKRLQYHMVELLLIHPYSGITLCFYVSKDSSHRCIQLTGITHRPFQQIFQFLLNGVFI